MDQLCANTLFFHGERSRNAYQTSAQLQYQDIRAVQDNGVPFDVLSSLTVLDVGVLVDVSCRMWMNCGTSYVHFISNVDTEHS